MKERSRWALIALLIGAMGLVIPVAARPSSEGGPDSSLVQEHFLQVFYQARDTYLDFYQKYTPHVNQYLMFREDAQQVPLIDFPWQGRIPDGATIVRARLKLYTAADSALYRAPCSVAAYCVRRGWDRDEATWELAAYAQRWFEPGCSWQGIGEDRCLDYSGTAQVPGVSKEVVIDVTQIVQQWVNYEAYGLVLRGYSGQSGKAAFYSSRWNNAALHPRLEVEYMNPPTPTPTLTAAPTVTTLPSATATSTPIVVDVTPTPTRTPAGSATLRIEPAFRSAAFGEFFAQAVVVDAGFQPIIAADVFVDYDPALLELVSVSDGSGLDILVKNVDPVAGHVDIGAGNIGTPAQGVFVLVTLSLRAREGSVGGSTGLEFAFSGVRTTVIRDETNENVLGTAEGAIVEIGAATATATPTSTQTSVITPTVLQLHLPIVRK